MPRDGSEIYNVPSGTYGVPDSTIESARYNGFVNDVAQDLNHARPIVAGGTGSTNALAALDALGAETAKQIITNYNSDVFRPGSFYSASTATGPPVAGHAFVGICYLSDANNIAVEARDQSDTVSPGRKYTRQKVGGVWSAWRNDGVNFNSSSTSISDPVGDMSFGLASAPSSYFFINSKADLSGTNLFEVDRAGTSFIRTPLTVIGDMSLSGNIAATGSVKAGSAANAGSYLFGNTGASLAFGTGTFTFTGGPLVVQSNAMGLGGNPAHGLGSDGLNLQLRAGPGGIVRIMQGVAGAVYADFGNGAAGVNGTFGCGALTAGSLTVLNNPSSFAGSVAFSTFTATGNCSVNGTFGCAGLSSSQSASVTGTVTATLGLVANAGGVQATGNSSITGTLSCSGTFTVQSPTGIANIVLNPVAAAQQAATIYYQSGTPIWFMGKQNDNSFLLFDYLRATPVLTAPSNGGSLAINVACTVSGTLGVTGDINPSAFINLGDSYTTSAIRIGTLGHFIGRDPADGSLLIGNGQAFVKINNPMQVNAITCAAITCTTVTASGAISGTNITASGRINGNGSVPAGMIMDFAGDTAPAGWFVCDGGSALVASFPDLFAAIGYKYGGSGANFNVPQLQDYFRRHRGGLSGAVGTKKGPVNLAHSHNVNGATGIESAAHTHGVGTLATGGMSANNPHSHAVNSGATIYGGSTNISVPSGSGVDGVVTHSAIIINSADIAHNHAITGSTGGDSVDHTHSMNFTSGGGSADDVNEARPYSVAMLTCIKY